MQEHAALNPAKRKWQGRINDIVSWCYRGACTPAKGAGQAAAAHVIRRFTAGTARSDEERRKALQVPAPSRHNERRVAHLHSGERPREGQVMERDDEAAEGGGVT